jgi:hypothetical protein
MLSNDIVVTEQAEAGGSRVDSTAAVQQDFKPQQQTGCKAALIVGQPSVHRSAATLQSIALRPLIELVRQTTQWGEDHTTLEERLGDFRFLILEFTCSDGLLSYVQIWSAPAKETMLEVGPGKRSSALAGAAIESKGGLLRNRGFEISGNTGNFLKFLPRSMDPPRVGKEMLALVTDVLGYDGSVELAYTMRQGTVLDEGHVMHGITRPVLETFLRVWGLEPTVPSDDPTVLGARSHGINFWVQLLTPHQSAQDVFWEVHCYARFAIPRERVADLLTEVNGNAWLVKGYACPGSDGETTTVRLSYGFDLGGVTPNHLKSRLFEWLENVRRLWSECGRPIATRLEATEPTGETVH